MGGIFRSLMNLPIFKSVLRPITRVLVGVIAIPIFRFIMRKLFRLQDLDDELEKDLEQWFRGALLLLAATANMEHLLFGWMDRLDWMDRMDWLTMGLRLMLAISVIEAMPDQELFAVIHPGPPKIKPGRSAFRTFWRMKWRFIKGFVCQHLNRSSPVLAMMAAIVGAQLLTLSELDRSKIEKANIVACSYSHQIGLLNPVQSLVAAETGQLMAQNAKVDVSEANQIALEVGQMNLLFRRHQERWIVGWVCYLLAITQYLIIGLVTSRDRALDVLSEFDRAVAERRRELIEEFQIEDEAPKESSSSAEQDSAPTPVSPEDGPDPAVADD